MCLHIIKGYRKRNFCKRFRNRIVKLWKVVQVDDSFRIKSIFYPGFRWKGGWNISNRKALKLTRLEEITGIVSDGIHVYLTKKRAEKSLGSSYPENNRFILPVYCHKKDLIAVGDEDAVFCKVKVLAKDLKICV